MNQPPTNMSFDEHPAQLQLTFAQIVLIDPLALDGLSAELQRVAAAPAGQQPQLLRELQTPLRIGLQLIIDFQPGAFVVGVDDFEQAGEADADARVADVDSGALVVIDLPYLGPVARTLSWGRYDRLLQAPVNDDTALAELNEEVGGPFFALVGASAEAGFSGDGAFRLRSGAPRRA